MQKSEKGGSKSVTRKPQWHLYALFGFGIIFTVVGLFPDLLPARRGFRGQPDSPAQNIVVGVSMLAVGTFAYFRYCK